MLLLYLLSCRLSYSTYYLSCRLSYLPLRQRIVHDAFAEIQAGGGGSDGVWLGWVSCVFIVERVFCRMEAVGMDTLTSFTLNLFGSLFYVDLVYIV